MPRFPYINFPFPLYKTPPYPPSNIYNIPHKDNYANSINIQSQTDIKCQSNPANVENNASRLLYKKNKSNKNTDEYLFDLFGLKIYYDDVLLVSLIYFLYSEGVKDDGLFIVLILLLLS